MFISFSSDLSYTPLEYVGTYVCYILTIGFLFGGKKKVLKELSLLKE